MENISPRNVQIRFVRALLGKCFPTWEAFCPRLNPPGGSSGNCSGGDSSLTEIIHYYREKRARSSEIALAIVKFVK